MNKTYLRRMTAAACAIVLIGGGCLLASRLFAREDFHTTQLFFWIYDYPSLNIGALFALVFAVVMLGAIFLLRYTFHSWFHRKQSANEMLNFSFSSFFVLYGLLLGLLAVAAYENFSNGDELVTKEASSLAALYSDLRGYSEPMRGILQSELRDYTQYVIEKSWSLQQKGIVGAEGTHRVTQFVDELLTYKPVDKSQEIIHAEALRQVNQFLELRRTRLANVSTGIPAVLWWVVGLGSLLTILLVAMLDMDLHVHIVLGCALSVFLGSVIFVIAALDNPFRGEVSVGPDAFVEVYETIMKPSDNVSSSMVTLMKYTGGLGAARLQGIHPVGGKDVQGLYFGETLMNNRFDEVDEVVKQHGGTATLFVKQGEAFVRIATNVKKNDGSRAIGTVLDPNGLAIEAIRKGGSYYGAATILGKPYITGYEPINDASAKTIGIYYVGFSTSR